MISNHQIDYFKKNGFLVVDKLLSQEEVDCFRVLYEDFLNGKISTEGHRSDLSGKDGEEQKELIVQIMRPSLLLDNLHESVLHKRAGQIARILMGDDMALDFDMMIDKLPFTNTETPWHQDEAYWINMDDKRAVSCWVALDDVFKDTGCMWFVPGSHIGELKAHQQIGNAGALVCEGTEDGAFAAEILAGSCTFHHGRTLHYSRGNSTQNRRRAFIANYRPEAMIEYEREQGFNHLESREVRQ